MSKLSNVIVDRLIHDLEYRPDDFELTNYTLDDKKTGAEYWIASGFSSFGVYKPFKMRFGVIQRIRFCRAFRKWKLPYDIRENAEKLKKIKKLLDETKQ